MDQLLRLKDRIVSKIFRILTLNFIFPLVYKKAAKKKDDPNKVVFVELRHPMVTNSFKVIFDELVSKYSYTVHTHFLRNGAGRKNLYLRRCNDMLRDIATAKYVFMNEGSNCIGSINLRPETKLTQLWHGCGAFKKFGLSTADLIFGETKKQQLKHPFNKNYSYVTISSPEVAWAYEEAMNLSDKKETIVATGSSRTDVFYDKDFIKSAYETLYDLIPQAKGKKVILYAPTFRGRVAHAKTSHMLNVQMFYEALGDDYVLIFKHHPLAKGLPKISPEYGNFAFDVTKLMNIEDLLCVSDICITDYSSLVFEYSLFEKPIIFFAYDLDEYFDWRGFYYDYFEMSPGPIHTTNLEMIDYIQNIEARFDKQRVKDFRYKFMRSCDGKATKRILSLVMGDEELSAHKNGRDKVEPYNVVPKSTSLFRDYLKKVSTLADEKEKFEAEFNKHISTPVVPKKVLLLSLSGNLRKLIQKNCKNAVAMKYGKDSLKDLAREIATSEFIFVDRDVKLLDMVELKEDTKVVRIPDYAFPFVKSDKLTLSYKSGIYKEIHEIAPMNRKCTFVPSTERSLNSIYQNSYGVDESGILDIGCVKTDLLLDEKFRKKALKKFYDLHPQAEGKKILLSFVTRFGNTKIQPEETDCDSYLYEYLKDEYCFIKYAFPYDENIVSEPMSCYTKSMFEVTKQLSVYEAMAIADVVTGSFENALFTFAVTGRPVFVYAPQYKAKQHLVESNFRFESIVFAPVFERAKDLAVAIADKEHYDYTRYNEFREKMLKNCDGNVAKRLLTKLGL